MFKRMKLRTLGTAAIALTMAFSAGVSSAVAGVASNPTIGNELLMEFNVTENVYENLVKLTWDGSDTELKTFNTKKMEVQAVEYVVSKGSDYDDGDPGERRVDIKLVITDADPDKIYAVGNEGPYEPVVENGFTTYTLYEDLLVSSAMNDFTGLFGIVFERTTAPGVPFTAKIVAVEHEPEESLLQPPEVISTFENAGDGQVSAVLEVLGDEEPGLYWWYNISVIEVSEDGGNTYTPIPDESGGTYYSYPQIVLAPEYLDFYPSERFYRIKANGYEDVIVPIYPPL